MSELKSDTDLFAGRYQVVRLSGTDKYGYIYEAVDRSDDSPVEIHEFFPSGMCRRDADSQNMAILKASAPEVSALYRTFSDYVTSLRDGKVSGMPRLVHAFKDHGTAYYVLPGSPRRRTVQEAPANPEPLEVKKIRPTAPTGMRKERLSERSPERTEEEQARVPSDTGRKLASYRNALLWYRIVIVLLIAIIALLIYLNFFTNSPKVSATGALPAGVEAVVPAPSDSLGGN